MTLERGAMVKGLLATLFLVLSALATNSAAYETSEHEQPEWIVAVGEAAGNEYDPPKEVMERARNEAKRRAVEEAVGSFIRAHTLLTNGQLAEDLVYARVRGRIEKVKILSEERDKKDPNLYRVRLKALVRPVYYGEEDAIKVKLSLSKDSLREGDAVKVFYQVNRDSYVYIFAISADNSVTLLFPNSLCRDNFVSANIGRVFPPENVGIRLDAVALPEMKGRTSQEKVKIIATRQKEILLERTFQEGLFQVYDAASTGLVGDLARKLNQLDPADWGEAVVAYMIEPGEAPK